MRQRRRPNEEDAFAREFLLKLQSGDADGAAQQLDGPIDPAFVRDRLDGMIIAYGRAAPLSVELVGINTFSSPTDRRADLTYQLHFNDRWLLANVVVGPRNGRLWVRAANLVPLKDSLAKINAFGFGNAGIRHYVVLACSIAVPLFILYTLVLAVRAKLKRKWLWIAFILV